MVKKWKGVFMDDNHYQENSFSLKRFLIAVAACALLLVYAVFFMD